MKVQSKYALNMNEVDLCHLTAENKQHLSITFVVFFFKKRLSLNVTLLSLFHKFILQDQISLNIFLFKYSFQASCVDNSIEFHSK